MLSRILAVTAVGALLASPALAAKDDPILNHNGPIPYSELQQIDAQGSAGYNAHSKTSKGHMRVHQAAPAAVGADTSTAAPVNPPQPADAAPAPADQTGAAAATPGAAPDQTAPTPQPAPGASAPAPAPAPQ